MQKQLEGLQAMNQKNVAEMELMRAALGKENRELKERVASMEEALDCERNKVAHVGNTYTNRNYQSQLSIYTPSSKSTSYTSCC